MGVKVSIIGCGRIGELIAEGIIRGEAGSTTLVSLFDRHQDKARRIASRARVKVATSFEEVILDPEVNLVVEAASRSAVREFGQRILESGKHLLVLSSGSLLEKGVLETLVSAARRGGVRIYVPSGHAIGLDVIKAGRIPGLSKVSIELRKPPKAWGEFSRCFDRGKSGKKKKEGRRFSFESTAEDIISLMPKISNFVATVSLAGIGPTKTSVRAVRDPYLTRSVTRIHMVSKSWEVLVESRNDWGAKTLKNSLTVSSVLSKLRELGDPLDIGT